VEELLLVESSRQTSDKLEVFHGAVLLLASFC
jgi:hypothetical protein